MITWPEIVSSVRVRQMNNGELLSKMIEVRRRYNADWVVPYVSEMDQEALPTTTPGLIAEAIDFIGMRAASVMPYMNSPAIDGSRPSGVRSLEYAGIRRKIMGATHHKSMTKLHLRRAMRHLAGYATTSMIVVPDFKTGMPRLELRDPLTSYPEPKAAEDLSAPTNAAFVFGKSVTWLKTNYPQVRDWLTSSNAIGVEMWDIVEWVDEDCTVIGILGPQTTESYTLGASGQMIQSMELNRWPNPTGICPAYIPVRVTLDKILSQIANLTGQVDLMAKLQALAIAAGEKAIFPDRYIIGDDARAPQLVGGQWKDGRSGEVNVILNAKGIGDMKGSPDPQTQQMIDRLERNVRTGTGLVPQAGGETYGALRTGRGMDSMMGTAVDPRVQEMQEIMEVALQHTNSVMLQQYKDYWPNKSYSMFSGWPGDKGQVDFTPSVHIETVENAVAYTIPGSDVQGTTVQLGQLLGMKAISLDTLRSRHPYIDDPNEERKKVDGETIEEALLQGLTNQVAQGAIPVTYLALVEKFRRKTADLVEAITLADAEMKKQQAAIAPAPADGQHAAPEQMPGLAGQAPPPPSMDQMPPEQGGPPPGAPPGPPGGGQAGLAQLLEALSKKPPTGGPPGAPQGAPMPVPAG